MILLVFLQTILENGTLKEEHRHPPVSDFFGSLPGLVSTPDHTNTVNLAAFLRQEKAEEGPEGLFAWRNLLCTAKGPSQPEIAADIRLF